MGCTCSSESVNKTVHHNGSPKTPLPPLPPPPPLPRTSIDTVKITTTEVEPFHAVLVTEERAQCLIDLNPCQPPKIQRNQSSYDPLEYASSSEVNENAEVPLDSPHIVQLENSSFEDLLSSYGVVDSVSTPPLKPSAPPPLSLTPPDEPTTMMVPNCSAVISITSSCGGHLSSSSELKLPLLSPQQQQSSQQKPKTRKVSCMVIPPENHSDDPPAAQPQSLPSCAQSLMGASTVNNSSGFQDDDACVRSTHDLVRGMDADGNKLINEYAIVSDLGKGSFGKVKLAVDNNTDDWVAIKILNKRNLEKNSRTFPLSPRGGMDLYHNDPLQLVHQEIEIMKKCRHPCLVKLINVIKDPNAPKLYLVMEFMEGGTLSKTPSLTMRSDSFPTIDIVRIRSYFLDVLYGLQFLHGKGVIHMDIKPENILVGKDGSCKLADFGVCTVLSDNFEADGGEREDVVHAKQGTPLYFAPEMLREGSFRGKATDVWALGVTMYVVVYGRLPFDGSTMSEYNENVATQDPVYYNTATEPEQHRLLTDVMRRMLCKDGSQRISVRDLLGHPFFNNMREDKVPLEWWVRCWKNSKSKDKLATEKYQ